VLLLFAKEGTIPLPLKCGTIPQRPHDGDASQHQP
jgi:hypothetical protein